jgi:hypothetical protein
MSAMNVSTVAENHLQMSQIRNVLSLIIVLHISLLAKNHIEGM